MSRVTLARPPASLAVPPARPRIVNVKLLEKNLRDAQLAVAVRLGELRATVLTAEPRELAAAAKAQKKGPAVEAGKRLEKALVSQDEPAVRRATREVQAALFSLEPKALAKSEPALRPGISTKPFLEVLLAKQREAQAIYNAWRFEPAKPVPPSPRV